MIVTPQSEFSPSIGSPESIEKPDFNPWDDVASNFMPRTLYEAWRICEFVYASDLTQRKATSMVVDYFLTSLKGGGAKDGVGEKKFVEMIKDDVRMMELLRTMGTNLITYSNCLISINFPFRRMAKCRSCSSMIEIEAFMIGKRDLDFKTERNTETGADEICCRTKCSKCRKPTTWEVVDIKVKDPEKIGIICWDPKRISIQQDFYSGRHRFWYDPHPIVRRQARSKDPFAWSVIPKSILVACLKGKQVCFDNRFTKFFSEGRIAGIDLGGWAPPSALSAFRRIFRLQILNRHDEALAIGYTLPVRLLSPDARGASDNALVMESIRSIMSNMDDIIEHHQKDGLSWYFSPYPMQYQSMGGEARSLAPKELIQDEEDRILSGRGVPPEFYRSNLNLQTAPVAMRLFERTHQPLVEMMNFTAKWMSREIASYLGSGDFHVTLRSVTIVDDIAGREWKQQAAAAGQISKETALDGTDIDPDKERDRILAEQEKDMVAQQEAQTRIALSQQSLASGQEQQGGEEAGGRPMGDIMGEARQIAMDLVGMDETTKNRELAKYRKQDEMMHAAILKQLDNIRSEGRSAGQQQGVQQVIEQERQQ